MKVEVVPCGFLKVDAEKMHNHFPSAGKWSDYNLDAAGFMRISMNGLLVEVGEQVVLFDPGCADFLPAKLLESYGLEIPVPLEGALEILGYHADQVTDVIFTHLHFDHGSGAFLRKPGRIEKRLPNARYHVLREHFEYAGKPDRSESGSYATFLFRKLEQLYWLEDWTEEWMRFLVFNGHTRGMVVPGILTPKGMVWYLTDLIPLTSFMQPLISSAYDLDPELARREKSEFLTGIRDQVELIFYHDPLITRMIYP